MVQAYILVQTEVGKAADVARQIAEIAGVMQAEDVTGPYDVIVRASAENVDELGKLVAAQIQAVEGITRTLTCPVVRFLSRGHPAHGAGQQLARDRGGAEAGPERDRSPQVFRRVHVPAQSRHAVEGRARRRRPTRAGPATRRRTSAGTATQGATAYIVVPIPAASGTNAAPPAALAAARSAAAARPGCSAGRSAVSAASRCPASVAPPPPRRAAAPR